MKTVTFLIPCYNSQEYMKKCIDNLLSTSFRQDIEILIVDDGSVDDTGVIADEYQKAYPKMVKTVHQENGGHGAAIMTGVEQGSGYFFKVVDSDDWLDSDNLDYYILKLKELKNKNVQLVITDYQYEYVDQKPELVSYDNVFKPDCIQTWEEMGSFSLTQYLMIHSCTFSMDILRKCDLNLPKHTFYEDNLFIYKPLPYVRNLYYMDRLLYHYQIGRKGQSMEEQNLKKRCDHQILVSKEIFGSYDLHSLIKKRPKLGKLMYRENVLMLSAATVFARLNKDSESEKKVKSMWKELSEIDHKTTRMIKYCSMAFWVTRPGKVGRNVAIMNYKMAHKILKFN